MKIACLVFILLFVGCETEQEQEKGPVPESNSLWNGKGFAGRCEDNGTGEQDKTTFFSVRGAMEDPFRSVAILTMSNGNICSAVLIAKDKLVTAAHCFEGKTSIVSARFKDSLTAVIPSLSVQKVTLAPDYQQALDQGKKLTVNPELASFDVALVTLAESVDDRLPIEIASTVDLYRGKLVSLVGYGDIGNGAGTKRFAQSHVGQVLHDYSIGGNQFSNLMLLDSSLGTGACPGDSGGGVFVKRGGQYFLVGLVNGVNDILYPGFPVKECKICPRGIGIVALLEAHHDFLGVQ